MATKMRKSSHWDMNFGNYIGILLGDEESAKAKLLESTWASRTAVCSLLRRKGEEKRARPSINNFEKMWNVQNNRISGEWEVSFF